MSLKAFHLFFVSASAVLAFGFAAWAVEANIHRGDSTDLVLGILSFLVGVLLVVYGVKVKKKLKEVSREGK